MAAQVRVSPSLSFYIGRQFALWFVAAFVTFVAIILAASFIEHSTRASGKEVATFSVVLKLTLLQLPNVAQESVPFAMLFGAMLAFWRLNRNHELVAVRAAGVSVWQFTLPALAVALGIAAIKLAAFNPIAAVLLSEYEQLESKYLSGRTSILAVSRAGVWLRQADESGQTVIYAEQARADLSLKNVIVIAYQGMDRFSQRMDASSAALRDGYWELRDARIYDAAGGPEPVSYSTYRLPTTLTETKIIDSFSSPQTISFWDLPEFIGVLEQAGFSAVAHHIHWHSLLAEPVLLCAMVLIAAAFSLRHTRRSGVVFAVSGGVITGFAVFLASKLVLTVASKGIVPAALAAWTPAGATTLLGLAFLLHMEDG